MPKQTDKELGLFFKNARHEQKLTYEELAEKAEMSSRYLKEIENGEYPKVCVNLQTDVR